jgi:pyruvate/2-oxoglutarate dehydrogenase complex dihydrolipoamide dehydrogenase (E3) component
VGSRGYIQVDDRLETSVPGIYAMGDVTGGPAFTHISYDDYRILAANLIDGAEMTTRGRPVPFTLYTDPQFGRVGITEREALDEGLDVLVAKMPMAHVVSMMQIAMMGKLPFAALRDAIFAHPTLAESLNNLFAKLESPATI